MNPRTLKALLPVLRQAREAGVLRIASGEGKNRVEIELAPSAPAAGEAMEAGTDPGAPDESRSQLDFLEEHYRLHGAKANPVAPTGRGS